MHLPKQRLWTLISIVVIVPLGLYAKFYQGPVAFWVNNSLGGLLYVTFWCLVFFFFFPRARPWKIAAAVLTVTCILETLQLWHPPFLEAIRRYFLGRALVGTNFVWSDFFCYVVGAGVGCVWMRGLRSR